MTGFLRSALHARWLRGALIALLLAAQHGALTHALSHAARVAHGQSVGLTQSQLSTHRHDSRTRQVTESCAFDLVYSQVLGGVTTAPAEVPAVAGAEMRRVSLQRSLIAAAPPPFHAQGPPVSL